MGRKSYLPNSLNTTYRRKIPLKSAPLQAIISLRLLSTVWCFADEDYICLMVRSSSPYKKVRRAHNA